MSKENDISRSSGEVQNSDLPSHSPRFNVLAESVERMPGSSTTESTTTNSSIEVTGTISTHDLANEDRKDDSPASTSGSPWYQLRKDATACVSQTLQRGCKNLWQLTTSRVSVLLSSSAVSSSSIHQFLKNYEDLSVFILAGETFCGIEAAEFRQKLKVVCENYFVSFHRQNIYVSCLSRLFFSKELLSHNN